MISCAKLAQLVVVYVSGQLLREGNLTIAGPVTSATSQDELKRAGRACCAH